MHPSSRRRWRRHCLLLAAAVVLALWGCQEPDRPTAAPKTDRQSAAHVAPDPAPPDTTAPTGTAAPPAAAEPAAVTPQPEPVRPQVAIIIDDMGYNLPLGQQFLQLHARLSFSFLPHAPHARELAQQAQTFGHDILVHLPMEPKEKDWRLEPETLMGTDSPEQIRKKVEKMLAAIPEAVGANNHMGSLFSENGQGMRVVIETLKERGVYFIDSATTPGSQGLAVAERLHLPAARRQLFLDNRRETGAICRQLRQLAALAQEQGQAIGIGHPHQAMLDAFNQCGDEALRSVHLIGVSRLVR